MSVREIGGYLQLETFRGEELYPRLHHLNLGRTALVALMRSLGLTRIYLPRFLCASVFEACEDVGYEILSYDIGYDLLPPPSLSIAQDAAFYLVNYYGQLTDDRIRKFAEEAPWIIVDNTHALFQAPLPGIPTLYSLRKFLGLPDGAYLSYDGSLELEGQDRSADRMRHILGRCEEGATAHYQDMLATAEGFRGSAPQEMSPLTRNLLRGIDYATIRTRRTKNFALLHEQLSSFNRLDVQTPDGAFCYPLMVSDGERMRRELAAERIYVPTYWRNVIDSSPLGSVERDLAANVVALPCDHRYGEVDMERVAHVVVSLLQKEER